MAVQFTLVYTVSKKWHYDPIPPTPLNKGGEGGIYCNLSFQNWYYFIGSAIGLRPYFVNALCGYLFPILRDVEKIVPDYEVGSD